MDNFSPTTVTDLQLAPVTSTDVERSFSTFKNICKDRRTKRHQSPRNETQL